MPLVEVRDVTRIFHRPDGTQVRAIDGFSMAVEKGTTLAVIGESGSGKSTLARVVLGLQNPDEGSVLSTAPT